jgi:hypothetical protein
MSDDALTDDENWEFIRSFVASKEDAPAFLERYIRAHADHKDRASFAKGGSISAGNTVGLGTFGTGDGGGTVGTSSGMGGIGNPFAGAPLVAPPPPPPPVAAPVAAPAGPPDPYNGRMPVGPGLTGTGWAFENGGLRRQEGLDAPTYNDVFTDFAGQTYMTGYDPALAMTGMAGGAGSLQQGLGAFLPTIGNNDFQAVNRDLKGEARYTDDEMKRLASNMGLDVKDLSGIDLQNKLNTDLKDYITVGGMSAGWNPTGDARQGNYTMYKRENGKLVPYQTYGYHAPEKGSWVAENPGILAPLAVVGGGLAATYLAGAGAAGAAGAGGGITGTGGASALGAYGAGSGAGALGTAGTGSLGAAGGLGAGYGTGALGAGITGAAGAGAGAGASSILGQAGQSALRGAGQGAIQSGIQGKNPIEGAIRGGITGGVSGGVGGYLGDVGAGDTLSGLGGKAAGMGTGMGISSIMSGDQPTRVPIYNQPARQPAQPQIPAAAPVQGPLSDSSIANSKYFTTRG